MGFLWWSLLSKAIFKDPEIFFRLWRFSPFRTFAGLQRSFSEDRLQFEKCSSNHFRGRSSTMRRKSRWGQDPHFVKDLHKSSPKTNDLEKEGDFFTLKMRAKKKSIVNSFVLSCRDCDVTSANRNRAINRLPRSNHQPQNRQAHLLPYV